MKKTSKRLAKARKDEAERLYLTQMMKDSKTLPLIIGQVFGGPEIPQPKTQKEFLELFTKISWVYACVLAISEAGSGIPINLYRRKKKGKKERIYDHPVLDLLRVPNPQMSQYDLLESALIYLELNGNAFWELNLNKLGKPHEIWPLRPDRMTINTTKNKKKVSSYTFRIHPGSGSKRVKFHLKEIIHFKNFCPTNDWYGQGSITAGVDSIVLEQYTNTFNKDFFRNGGTPQGILVAEEYVSKREAKRIEKKWAARLSGLGKSHKTPLMPKGLKYQPIGTEQVNMQFLDIKKLNRVEIFALFGVPPVKVGIMADAKYSNYGLQETMFYKDTIAPKLRRVAGTLTAMLCPFYDKDLFLEFDLVKFISGDPSKIIERMVKEVQSGIRTPNEAREDLGREPYEGGNRFFVASHLIEIGTKGGGGQAARQQRSTNNEPGARDEPIKIEDRPSASANIRKHVRARVIKKTVGKKTKGKKNALRRLDSRKGEKTQ